MNWNLTKGGMRCIFNNDSSRLPYIIQVIEIKKIITPQSQERFRLVLSDGDEYMQGMLASQLSSLGKQTMGGISKNSIIKVEEFVSNDVSGRKICIVVKCDVLGTCPNQIGNPQNVDKKSSGAPQSPPHNNNNNNNNNMSNMPSSPQQQQQQQQPQQPQQPPPVPNQFRNNFGQQQQQGPPPPPSFGMNRNNNNNRSATNIQPNRFNATPQGMNSSGDQVQPVSSLNPYQNNWRIKVRCTNKDAIRYYKNMKGEGKVFSVDLLDKNGDEIRATMFNETVDKFYPIFERHKIYIISKGQVKVARKQFTHIKNDYAITLNSDSDVIPVDEDQDIDQQTYKFIPISSLESILPNEYVDVIGIIEKIGDLNTVFSTKLQGKELKKRTLILIDQTAKIDVTVWDSIADEFEEDKIGNNAVVAFKAAKVSEFGGRSLSSSSTVEIWPQRSEATQLTEWYNKTHGENINNNLTNKSGGNNKNDINATRKTFQQIKDQQIGLQNDEKGEYFTIKATITSIAHSQEKPPWYKACPDNNEKDNKYKVVEDGQGGWYCSHNNKRYNSYVPRYIIRFCASDFSGQQWMNCFHDEALKILHTSATDAENYLQQGQHDEFEKIFQNACFKKHLFKVRAKCDTYQEERRARFDVTAVIPLDTNMECKELIAKIKELQLLKQS